MLLSCLLAAAVCNLRSCRMGIRVLLLLGLCFTGSLIPALSLRCYYDGERWRDGKVFPYVIKPTEVPSGNPACVSFQLDCTTVTNCAAGDDGKWTYTFTELEDCPKWKASQHKHLKCCNADNCNAPDRAMDITTKIIPQPPWFQP
jgi:hypothetical protein